MTNIFLDCGTHLCEGLTDFSDKGIINNTFEIHTFEANPACNIEERIKKLPLNITPYNKAVWVEDGFVEFRQENHTKSHQPSPNDGYSDIDGWASSVDGIGFEYIGYEEKIQIPSINFSRFVSELPQDSNIICKMDIEGSEFAVLRHMIREGTITRINELYVEFHERYMTTETEHSKQDLVDHITSLGVKVHQWF
jgi:FkbM family methyltransferase